MDEMMDQGDGVFLQIDGKTDQMGGRPFRPLWLPLRPFGAGYGYGNPRHPDR